MRPKVVPSVSRVVTNLKTNENCKKNQVQIQIECLPTIVTRAQLPPSRARDADDVDMNVDYLTIKLNPG